MLAGLTQDERGNYRLFIIENGLNLFEYKFQKSFSSKCYSLFCLICTTITYIMYSIFDQILNNIILKL